MTKQEIKTVDFDEFESIADRFIERSSQEYGEMPASAFFKLLFEKMAERVTETIELEGEIVDNQLVLHVPVDGETTIHVNNNEIVVGDRRIIVRLKDESASPTVQ